MTNVVNGAPAWLAPDFRYAGDDWSGDNALTYVVYETAPVYASDGVTVVTAGVPRDLTGCTVVGSLRYQSSLEGSQVGVLARGAVVDALGGLISLSLPSAQTRFPPQPYSAWGTPGSGLLVAQPRVVDSDGNAVTVGLQPIFVF